MSVPTLGLVRRMHEELAGPAGPTSPRVELAMAWLCLLLPPLLFIHALADTAISLVAVAHLYRSFRRRDFAWVRQGWLLFAFLFWVYATARGLLSPYPLKSGSAGFLWIRFIVFAAGLQFLVGRSASFRALLLASSVAATLFGAADTILQFVVGHDLFGRPMVGSRLTGPLSNPAIGALLLFAGMPALIVMLRYLASRGDVSQRIASAFGVVVLGGAIFLSGERMVLLLFSVALIACLLVVVRSSWRFNAIVLLSALAFAAVVYGLSPEILERHSSLLGDVASGANSIYMQIWRAAFDVFAANPVFGIGIKNFRYECLAYVPPDMAAPVCGHLHPHQLWLEILAETGVAGAALMLGLFIAALGPALARWRTWREEPLLAGATLGVLLRLWPLATAGSFFVNRNQTIFWTMMAVAIACSRIDRACRPPSRIPRS